MRRYRIVFPLLFCLLLFLPSAAGAVDAATEAALDRLKTLTASVASVRAAFTQTTTVPLFAAPVVSRGALLFRRPDALVWEYTAPVAQGLAFAGDNGVRWEEDKARRVPFTLAQDPVAGLVAAQMLAWIRFDRPWIEANYDARAGTGEGITLTLIPRRAEVRSVLRSLTIRFGAEGIARSIRLEEAAGGVTAIDLHDVVINGPVTDAEFR